MDVKKVTTLTIFAGIAFTLASCGLDRRGASKARNHSKISINDKLRSPKPTKKVKPKVRKMNVTCKSYNNRKVNCPVHVEVQSAIVSKSYAKKSVCQKSKSWGYTKNSVWVSSNCRAKFKVSYVKSVQE